MNDIGYSVIWLAGTTIILYIIGIIHLLKERSLYKRIWIYISFILLPAPFLIFTLSPFFINKKRNTISIDKENYLKFKALFYGLSYILSFVTLNIFFKFGMGLAFCEEMSIVCVNVVSVIYQLFNIIIFRHLLKMSD